MAGTPARSAERLPRGRHGLSREEVVRSQRARLQRAMAEVMAEKGYAGTSVAEVLRAAKVSRETFYQQFSSKEDCFMSAYERGAESLVSGMSEAQPRTGGPIERFEHAIESYLEALAAEPEFARLFLLEVYAAGPAALKRRAQAQQLFVALLAELFGARSANQRFACEALVAAISSMVTARLAENDVEGLRALRAPLTDLVRSALASDR